MAGRRAMSPQPATIPFFPDGGVGPDPRCQPILPFAAFQVKPAYRTSLRWLVSAFATSQLATVQAAARRTCRTAVLLAFFFPERSVVICTTTASCPAGP